MPRVPAGLGTAWLLPVPPVRWEGERGSRRHPRDCGERRAGGGGRAPVRAPRGAGTRIRPCPRDIPGQRWDAGPARGRRRALAAAVSAAEHVPGRRGQGRCSEARGTFPTAPPPGEPVARRGAAARRSPGSLEEKQPGRHAARQGKGLRAAGGGGRARCPRCPHPADGGVVAGAGGAGGAAGAALRRAAPAPPGGRQGAQAAAGADPELRRAARGAAGAAVRAAGGGHAQRLPPHPAARAAGPPAQRQLPRRGTAARRQEGPAPRQPAQRIALGIQVTPGAGGRGVRPPRGLEEPRRCPRAPPALPRRARGGSGGEGRPRHRGAACREGAKGDIK